ncbi:50S ribosomal protein L35 [Flexivirga endophytica]|uniref:Large ribosomal subunit protein bL35 n=1 Tax=Flexivirga endophytica TaxID=1849103 RepID=A0A916TG19_9MICO|nr:50S ribosomal protein L35 [Flexivirga endophytica]GGB42289.1 50S ribosomal protein L35 [Flexivirga endophytica]GHB70478.1 50S ribosomal protein L35 [Flexivirga endophytica]
MPKMKTHSGAKKRFKISGSGKVIRQRARHVHKFQERTSSQARRLANDVEASGPDSKKIKKLLGK